MKIMKNLSLGVFILFMSNSSTFAQGPEIDMPIPVKAVVVTKGSLEQSLSLTGTVYPRLKAIVSSEIAGKITLFSVDEGTFVEDGELICQLHKAKRMIQLEAAKARLEQAQAELAKTEAGYRDEEIKQRQSRLEEEKANWEKLRLKKQRIEELFNKKMASLEEKENSYWEHEESRAQIGELQAALELAKTGNRVEDILAAKAVVAKRKAELEEIKYELDRTTITAPFSGVIISKDTEKGEWVKEGERLAEIICLEKVLIHAKVPEKDISKIKLGQVAKMSLDAYPDEIFTGSVKQIVPQADVSNRNFPIRIEVENPKHHLLSGMSVRIKIPVKKEAEVLLVPKEAVIKSAEGEYLFVVRGDTAYKVKVETGLGDSSKVAVKGALTVRDMVIVTNNESLRDMTKILIRQ